MKQWYMVIDIAKCENCNNCFLACRDEFTGNDWPGYSAAQPDHGQRWINIFGKERGKFPFIDVAYLPVQCMHCSDAPCIKAGKGSVYRRGDGIVIIDPQKSKGQKDLLSACPYDAIWWNNQIQVPQKCTFCAHLLDNSWAKPRCVQSCPTGAMTFLKLEPAEMERKAKEEGLEFYLPENKTSPHVYYKNLYRYLKCFIGGSVATKIDGKEECAEGTAVVLLDKAGNKIAETSTDNFGDFKFDSLLPNSGSYTIIITYADHPQLTIQTTLGESQYIGVINV